MGTKVNPKASLNLMTKNLIGRSYELGKTDCFSIIYEYLRNCKITMPVEFRGISLKNYSILYEQDKGKAKKIMIDFINSILSEISFHSASAGDLLLLQYKNEPAFLSICLGHGKVLAVSPEFGVNIISRSFYTSIKGWKVCRKQFQLQLL